MDMTNFIPINSIELCLDIGELKSQIYEKISIIRDKFRVGGRALLVILACIIVFVFGYVWMSESRVVREVMCVLIVLSVLVGAYAIYWTYSSINNIKFITVGDERIEIDGGLLRSFCDEIESIWDLDNEEWLRAFLLIDFSQILFYYDDVWRTVIFEKDNGICAAFCPDTSYVAILSKGSHCVLSLPVPERDALLCCEDDNKCDLKLKLYMDDMSIVSKSVESKFSEAEVTYIV